VLSARGGIMPCRLMYSEAFDLKVFSKRETFVLLGLSEDTFRRLEESGEAPDKIQLSDRRVGYTGRAIREWQDARRIVPSARQMLDRVQP
jgi:predicted DNA-binding transcriptional regulator AlpA